MHLDIRIKAIKFIWFKTVSVWMFSDQTSKFWSKVRADFWWSLFLSQMLAELLFLCVL